MAGSAPDAGASKPTLLREEETLALTYGVEARRHYGDRPWKEIEPALASGWRRLRTHSRTEWSDVVERVEAGWRCPQRTLDS